MLFHPESNWKCQDRKAYDFIIKHTSQTNLPNTRHVSYYLPPQISPRITPHSVLPDISREAFLWKDGKQESFNTSVWLHPLPVSMMARDFCTSDHPCLHQNLLHAPTLPHINPLLILLVQECNTRQTSTACILTTPNSDRAINFYFIFVLAFPQKSDATGLRVCWNSPSYRPAYTDSYCIPESQAAEKAIYTRNLLSHYSKKYRCIKMIQRIFYCLTHLVIKPQ